MTRIQFPSVAAAALFGLAVGLTSEAAYAQVVAAEPATPIEVDPPAGASAVEAQVVLQVIVDATEHVESSVVSSHVPTEIPPS